MNPRQRSALYGCAALSGLALWSVAPWAPVPLFLALVIAWDRL